MSEDNSSIIKLCVKQKKTQPMTTDHLSLGLDLNAILAIIYEIIHVIY